MALAFLAFVETRLAEAAFAMSSGEVGPSSKRPRGSLVQIRGGTVDYMDATSDLAAGPSSLQELADWPLGLAQRLCTQQEGVAGCWQDRRACTEAALRFGLEVDTDFSGKSCAETAYLKAAGEPEFPASLQNQCRNDASITIPQGPSQKCKTNGSKKPTSGIAFFTTARWSQFAARLEETQ